VGVVAVLATALSASIAVAATDTVGLVDPTTGVWSLRTEDGLTHSFYFGNPRDIPFAGDWNCDGVDTPGLYRQSDGYVYLRNSNDQGNANVSFFFGNPGDLPIAGDFNGDGCDTVSVYRPSESRVFIINELGSEDGGLGAADTAYYFGNPGDSPFTGDFDDDDVDTIGLYRQSTGLVYFSNSHAQGNADFQFFFGDPGDRFVGGDWTNDGTDTAGVFRPSQSMFYLKYTNSSGNADDQFGYGNGSMLPVAGNWGDIPAIPELALVEVASGLDSPMLAVAPMGDARLFIAERGGDIRILKNGAINASDSLFTTRRQAVRLSRAASSNTAQHLRLIRRTPRRFGPSSPLNNRSATTTPVRFPLARMVICTFRSETEENRATRRIHIRGSVRCYESTSTPESLTPFLQAIRTTGPMEPERCGRPDCATRTVRQSIAIPGICISVMLARAIGKRCLSGRTEWPD